MEGRKGVYEGWRVGGKVGSMKVKGEALGLRAADCQSTIFLWVWTAIAG